ncbi:MAG: MaoC/PaaZ C-terminal domain-containing protein [Hyphomicrobiaceae bacterium]
MSEKKCASERNQWRMASAAPNLNRGVPDLALDHDKLMSLQRTATVSHRPRDHALRYRHRHEPRPYDPNELAYTFEKDKLKTVASMATVLQRVPLLKDCGYDYTKVVHGEQRLTLHKPLEPEGAILVDSRVAEAYDKGPGKGAIIYTELKARDATTNEPLYTLMSTTFARGDGGYGGPAGQGPAPHELPTRKPDLTAAAETRLDQALLYRLNGDRNPLHADPELAKRVGFPVPILHGLCTYGTACRTILKEVAKYDHTGSAASTCAFPRPSIPARPSSRTCGSTPTSSPSAAASRSATSPSSTTASARWRAEKPPHAPSPSFQRISTPAQFSMALATE